ncbi:MAG: hypothetical protein ICV87_14210 [Gemmatimonadetes bacterium]|nr:hypothetical protein [Gemmatimonadota bacterium]
MAQVQDRVRDARQQVMADAFARWVERWRGREVKRTLVAVAGPGAADPAPHNAAFIQRERRRSAFDPGLAAERTIGGWDGVYFAPSERARAGGVPPFSRSSGRWRPAGTSRAGRRCPRMS